MSSPPAYVVVATSRWLDDLDEGLQALADLTGTLEPELASCLAAAVADVADRVGQFRSALSGTVELTELLPSRWTPLGSVELEVADKLGPLVVRIASLPPEVISAVHSGIADDSMKRAFLLQIGEVASAAFVNLARTLWSDHPHLAPPGWNEAG